MKHLLKAAVLALLMSALAVRAGEHQPSGSQRSEVRLLASGLMGTIGSTIGNKPIPGTDLMLGVNVYRPN